MRRRREEDAIQRAVFNHLRYRGAPNIVAFHVPNGGKRSRLEAAIMKGLGVVAGVPDIVIIKDGQVFMPELKTAKGRLTGAQRDMQPKLRAAGAHTAVCYGLDQALRWLETNGLLRGVMER